MTAAARAWPIAVVVALLSGMATCGLLLWAANAPGGAAAEPDYYAQAVRWDSTLAERRASDALGWSADVTLGPAGPGGANLEVRLRDREGRAVDGAALRVTGIHNAEPGGWVRGGFTPMGAGRYSAGLGFRRAGRWEIRLEARRGADRYLTIVHRDAVAGPS